MQNPGTAASNQVLLRKRSESWWHGWLLMESRAPAPYGNGPRPDRRPSARTNRRWLGQDSKKPTG